MDDQTKQFHSLFSFIIRNFFFVYLGMMVGFQKIEYIIVGILILLAILALRQVAVMITTYKGGFERDDKQVMTVMMPRGLAAAILAISYGKLIVGDKGMSLGSSMSGFFEDVSFVIILGTAIITTVGVSVISHMENKKIKFTTDENNIDTPL